MALTVDIAANTRQAQSQVKDLSKSLDSVSDSLDDVAADGKDAGQKLEKTFREMTKDAEKAGTGIKEGISDGLKDGAKEAKSSGKEAAASFSGEFEDVGDFIQETAANAFEGFGPLGAAAGIAAAVGIGAITAETEKQAEAAQKMKEYFADAYQTAADEGRKYIDVATIIAETNNILFDPDRVGEYNQAVTDSKTLGLDINTLVQARAGDQDALNTVLARTAEVEAEIKAKAEEGGSTAIRLSLDEQRELDKVRGKYEDIGKLHDTNAENLARSQDIAAGLHEKERDQIQRTRDASQAAYEAMAQRYANPIVAKVKVEVDSSSYDNWRPSPKTVDMRVKPVGVAEWQ